MFSSRINSAKHLSTRQYARIVKAWVTEMGLDASIYGTHYAAHQIVSDISTHEKLKGCTTVPRSPEVGKPQPVR
ncbi:hypothetical protein HALA3H3_600004 [Halomonas sp. A3H3]|nr:hypothetical protein HALA3H3_600004 [Halomonas sp. A3H3]